MSRLEEIKNIDIVSFLSSKGFKPQKESESKVWFCSPFRGEQSPSFCVFRADNKWKDYGAGLPKGDIIDLVQELEGCDRITAMDLLSSKKDLISFEPIEVSSEPLLTVDSVYDSFISPELIVYLQSRKIPKNVYSKYVKECHYHFKETPNKKYYAVGFKNDEGGWELRNGIGHKYATSPKAPTTFVNGGHTLNVFEGFINYMSCLTYFSVERLEGDTIVLNGLGMYYRIVQTLKKYEKVNCFLDWGTGGNTTTDMIRSVVGHEKVYDNRYLFNEDEDFNDMLIRISNSG